MQRESQPDPKDEETEGPKPTEPESVEAAAEEPLPIEEPAAPVETPKTESPVAVESFAEEPELETEVVARTEVEKEVPDVDPLPSDAAKEESGESEITSPEANTVEVAVFVPPVITGRKPRQSILNETEKPNPAEPETPTVLPVVKSRHRVWLRRVGIFVAILVAWPFIATLIYTLISPPVSNLMLIRALGGNGITKQWVSLDQISKHVPNTVITSEDARFCSHHGVDWVEFGEIVEDVFDDDEGAVRGASTISMQTAKNLFLWEGRGPFGAVRKLLEMPLAFWMDLVWSKRRMLEIYLNIVEWAPGVYGIEAASQHHFKKSAAKLTRREAALLAAVLPNPIKRKAGKPSRRVRQTADRIVIRSAGMGPYLTCLQP